MIGVLPGEGEALAQFDSIFLTQFHWEQFSAVEATSAIELEQEESEAKFVTYGKDPYWNNWKNNVAKKRGRFCGQKSMHKIL